jgi:hypothetical protein
MTRLRFNIGTLLAIVLFLAIGFAALREATDLWDSGVFTLTSVVLLVGVMLSVHRTGKGRAFWLGFALFGWAYLVASLIPSVESRLLTTKGLTYLNSKIPGRAVTASFTITANTGGTVDVIGSPPNGQTLTATSVRLWNTPAGRFLAVSPESFVRIGHSLLSLIVALAGGRLSCWLAREDRHEEPSMLSKRLSKATCPGSTASPDRNSFPHELAMTT